METGSHTNVVIVGNGASLLDSNLGEIIDAHEVVVRFNHFVTAGFSADVGNRTSIWFVNRNVHHPTMHRDIRRVRCDEIFVHTWADERQAADSFRNALMELGRDTKVTEVPKSALAEMQVFLGTDYRCFSTGAVGVWMMLKKYQRLNLVGFDWWNEPPMIHYFNDGQKPPDPIKGHRPLEEKVLFERLESKGKVSFLAGE